MRNDPLILISISNQHSTYHLSNIDSFLQGSVQETCLCKRQKKPGHGVIPGIPCTSLYSNKICTWKFPVNPEQNLTWPLGVMVLSSSQHDESAFLKHCLISELANMSQLVRRQVKPLISTDQVEIFKKGISWSHGWFLLLLSGRG